MLVTVLKSPSRIGRHLPRDNAGISVVGPEWITESIDQGFVQPYAPFAVDIPVSLRPKPFQHKVISRSQRPTSSSPPQKKKQPDEDSQESVYTTDEEDRLEPGSGNLDPNYPNHKYECQRFTPIDHKNKKLIDQLKVLAQDREIEFEEKHASAYRRAIASLKAYTKDVRTSQEAEQLSYIGPKIGAAIKEFLRKGYIPEAKKISADPTFAASRDLMRVHGAGPKAVRSWISKGYRSVDDLIAGEGFDPNAAEEGTVNEHGKRPSPSKPPAGPAKSGFRGGQAADDDDDDDHKVKGLTDSQKKGLKWFEAFTIGMSGGEVERIHSVIREVAEKVCPGSIVDPLDEYRRGHRDHIRNADVLITPPSIEHFGKLLDGVLKELAKRQLIKDVLQIIDDRDDLMGSRLPMANVAKKVPGRGGESSGAPVPAPGSGPAIALERIKGMGPDQDPTRKAMLILADPKTGKPHPVHIYVVPPPCRHYALVVLTGSELFVRSLRESLAKVKGLKIFNHGIFNAGDARIKEECRTEEEVFQRCGLEFIPPEGRNC